MNLDDLANTYGMVGRVNGILHAGAHLAEEAPDYERVFGSALPVWWVEANPAVTTKINAVLQNYKNQILLDGMVAEVDGAERSFHVSNYDGMSSSLLDFGTHPEFSPDTVFVHSVGLTTITIDSLVANHNIKANMLVMDIQGAEALALAGAQHLFPHLDFVMSEVNKKEVYLGCAKIWDLDDVLLANGLKRVETYWVGEQGWGDALYVKTLA